MSSPVTTEVESPSQQEVSLSDTDLIPVGVERESVDPYTLLVIEKLFPAPTSGLEFLALLLRWAIVKQLSHGLGESGHAAVITVQSIRQLATLIGWSYETTHKYVVLFCALGLLVKRRMSGKVELHFALSRYEPPLSLDALDTLIERYRHHKRGGKTDKRLRHAERVKHRFLLLYGSRKPAAVLPPSPQTDAASSIEVLLQDAIGDIEQLLLAGETSEATRECLTTILATLERVQGRFADRRVDDNRSLPEPVLSANEGKEQGEESTQREDSGGRQEVVPAPNPPETSRRVDSSSPQTPRKGRFAVQEGDSEDFACPSKGVSHEQLSPLSVYAVAQKGRLSLQRGDSSGARTAPQGRRVEQKGDSSLRPGVVQGRLSSLQGDSPVPPPRETSPRDGQITAQRGRLTPPVGDSSTSSVQEQRSLPQAPGESVSPLATRKSRLLHRVVDSTFQERNAEGGLSVTKVDSSHHGQQEQGRLRDETSPIFPSSAAQNGRLLAQLPAQSAGPSTQKVDSGAATSANVDVVIYTIIDSLNVNVRGVIEYLRKDLFKEPPQKRGFYYNLYGKQECRNADAWLAAALETLVGVYQAGTVKFPGKYFYDRCIALHRGGIPPETAALVERYSQLTYAQLLQVLKPSVPPVPSPAPTPRLPMPRRPAIQLHIPRDKQRAGMSRAELKYLLDLIEHDERTCNLAVQPYLQADGSCALLIDDDMGHQRWVYSLHEWQQRLVGLHTLRDLFSR